MIYEGSEGSLCGYYKGILICSVPLTPHKTLEYYKSISESVTRDALKGGHSIKTQILLWMQCLTKMLIYKKSDNPTLDDREVKKYTLTAILCLIKFKIIDENSDREGLLICPKYRQLKKKEIRSNSVLYSCHRNNQTSHTKLKRKRRKRGQRYR